MPGGNRGLSPSAMYPSGFQTSVPGEDRIRTEWHLYTLFWVEYDRRVILEAVTSEHGDDGFTLTLYGISDNGTEDDGLNTRQRFKVQWNTFISYHEFGNAQCCIGCHLDRPEVPCWKP